VGLITFSEDLAAGVIDPGSWLIQDVGEDLRFVFLVATVIAPNLVELSDPVGVVGIVTADVVAYSGPPGGVASLAGVAAPAFQAFPWI
jgi:hypothetical protein